MPHDGAFDLLKPFAWLALAAFLVGFAGALAFAAPSMMSASRPSDDMQISAPSSNGWDDAPKRI